VRWFIWEWSCDLFTLFHWANQVERFVLNLKNWSWEGHAFWFYKPHADFALLLLQQRLWKDLIGVVTSGRITSLLPPWAVLNMWVCPCHSVIIYCFQVKSGVKQLVHFVSLSVCLSVCLSTNFSLWSRTNVISIECYILNINRRTNLKFNVTLALNLSWSHMRRETAIIFLMSACLAVKQNLKSFQTGNVPFLRMWWRTQTTGTNN